ncbi:helix-turn-helix transcriptional regulator [Pseudomonas putida]|uniref:helix-turn-helix domain-containing protein n=1 Tax=Pseudomonas putida TaxID=303 RepID=UPI002B24900C|nr:helix-turn-helix transcriptional regulator [Pseudomonas putida]
MREERERLGLKQEDLAVPGGVNRNTQGSYERGVRNPDTAYLAGVATLGVDLVYVISGRRVVADGLSPVEAEIIEQYRSIPHEDQRSIRRFLKAMFDDANQ